MLLDIMLNGRFVCQLNYKKKGYYTKANGKLVEVHSDSEIAHFVESVRPSLKGKNYNVCFTNNKTW
jgi:hypothetical protein